MKAGTLKRATAVLLPAAAPGARPPRRFILPSGRVAEFSIPHVGEYGKMRRRALLTVAKGLAPDVTPNATEIILELTELCLKRNLIGCTDQPVESIFVDGFNPDVPRAEGKAKGLEGEELEEYVQAAMLANEDADAMKASARCEPVNDFVWDTKKGYVGTLETSELGTEQAADWEALNSVAKDLIHSFQANRPPGPKAQTRPMRPLR